MHWKSANLAHNIAKIRKRVTMGNIHNSNPDVIETLTDQLTGFPATPPGVRLKTLGQGVEAGRTGVAVETPPAETFTVGVLWPGVLVVALVVGKLTGETRETMSVGGTSHPSASTSTGVPICWGTCSHSKI